MSNLIKSCVKREEKHAARLREDRSARTIFVRESEAKL
jgi:hypothetical protein